MMEVTMRRSKAKPSPLKFQTLKQHREPDEADGAQMLHRLYEAAEPASLTLLLISSMKDAAALIREHEEELAQLLLREGPPQPAAAPLVRPRFRARGRVDRAVHLRIVAGCEARSEGGDPSSV